MWILSWPDIAGPEGVWTFEGGEKPEEIRIRSYLRKMIYLSRIHQKMAFNLEKAEIGKKHPLRKGLYGSSISYRATRKKKEFTER